MQSSNVFCSFKFQSVCAASMRIACFALLLFAVTPLQPALAATANINLTSAVTRVALTTDTEWTLDKYGSLAGDTVTWSILATATPTLSGQLLIQGQMTVTNTGAGAGTIGNVVVNLQKRQGKTWITQSSNVANATDGDAATTANIHKAASSEGQSSFTENSASGELHFMDTTNNTIFSLVPQVQIASGETRTLLFQASFDNTILQLAAGTTIRTEVIVSFGNATASGNSTANVDINGNGAIDADEARVRSVPTRLTSTVPAQIPGNATVTLTDALSDITKTGTVTFSNTVFNLGTTSGTVTATVSGGTDGGTITNCAHLTSASSTVNSGGYVFPLIDGVNEEACSTVTVGASTCTPGTAGCGWKTGNLTTYPQADWGDETTTAGALLGSNFSTLYPADLIVGDDLTMRFRSAAAVWNYLPASGISGVLNANLVDPDTTSAGGFGGQVVALQLNVDFSDANVLASTTPLGDLRICAYTLVPAVNGMTVNEFVALANDILGGNTSAIITADRAATVATAINTAFTGGAPSTFAQNNLRVGTCGWEASDLTTYEALTYGNLSSAAGALLASRFSTAYPSGLIAGSTFTVLFDSASRLITFLGTQTGTPGMLTQNVENPDTTSAGTFAADVLALRINVDFAEADYLPGVTDFGDLYICKTSNTSLNGMTVAQFLAAAETILGGQASSTFTVSQASSITNALNRSFLSGTPSTFAQNNLRVGTCGWEAGDMLTLSQTGWDASTVLSTYFATLYGANLGVEVGITGTAGYSMKFSSPTRVRDYLPAGGTVGALNADLLNPTTTPSGNFGGEVLALQLNVDYSANGYLGGTSGLALGDLHVCGLSTASLNGKTVDAIRAIANELIGGNATTGYAIADISLLAAEINGAFSPSGASTFAQAHLVNGSCP